MQPLVVTPLKKPLTFPYRICAFDTETDGLGGDLLCITFAVLDLDGCLLRSGILEGRDMVSRFFGIVEGEGAGVIWYAHNAAYDWRYLFPHIAKNHAYFRPRLGLRGENMVYQIELFYQEEKAQIILRDSMAFYPQSLADLSKRFCPEHAKLSGAVDFSVENFDIKNSEHRAYAIRDAESLALSMYRLNEKIESLYDVPMGATASGTALKAWRRTITKPFYTHRPSLDFCRKAYYGGIVFLTDTKPHKNCVTVDINSCYPFVMRQYGVPDGVPIHTRRFHSGDVPAIYHCRITAPDDLRVPIIPARVGGYTRWLRGRIETFCTNREIEFALAHGYSDLEILDGWVWDAFCYPFKQFVNMAEKIRAEFRGSAEEVLAKLIQNGLYGKFATKQTRQRVFIPESDEECEGAEPLDVDSIFWVREETDENVYCNPAWSAFITAHARLHLLRNVYDVIGVERVLYGDTDSITFWGDAVTVPTSNDYGDFKVEKRWAVFRAIAPKVYAGQLISGEWAGRVKGVPRRNARGRFEELFHQGVIDSGDYLSLSGFFVGVRTGFTPAEKRHRMSTDIANSSSWVVMADGSVFPRFLGEVDGGPRI